MKIEFSRRMFEKYPNIKCHENPFRGRRVVRRGPTDRLTDRHDEFNCRFSQFCESPSNPGFCRRYIYIYIYMYTHIHTYIRTDIHTYLHTHIHTYVRTYIHTYIHTYIYTYIHTYIYTYIHTYIHTYMTWSQNGGRSG